MSVVFETVIKQEELDVEPQRVSFRDLVAAAGDRGEAFVPLLPNGRVPELDKGDKPPELSVDELHLRRLETIERETYQKAFAAGEEAGLALGEQTMEREMARLLPQFESVLRQLDGLPKRVFASAESFLVETAIMLTRELVAHELSINPQEISHRVNRLLEQAAGRRDMVIYVAPDSAALLQQIPGLAKLRIEGDATVGLGSVRLVSDFGGMEDNLERQLADMEAGLRSFLQDRLQSSGNEDLAAASAQYAQRLAAQGRPLVLPTGMDNQEVKAAQAAAPMLPAAPAVASAIGAVRLEEIADAVAEQVQEEAWHHPSRSGSSLVGSFLDEDEASYMEETIVSTALTGRINSSHWAPDQDAKAEQFSEDEAVAEEDRQALLAEEEAINLADESPQEEVDAAAEAESEPSAGEAIKEDDEVA
ncbi:MAG: hypothetical protein HQM06_03845 [Magnetococcales bacterium]|nr:hypothetical protein [Magnetococcales bacterium]